MGSIPCILFILLRCIFDVLQIHTEICFHCIDVGTAKCRLLGLFFLSKSISFFVTLILFRTLLNRNLWLNPLSDVMGGWGLWIIDKNTGEKILTTESIENVAMMLPFTVLLFWTAKDKILGSVIRLKTIIWKSVKITFLFSLTIEFLQLFLRLGTFQLSDLFYNTLGGLLGGIIYFIGYKVCHKE